MNKGFMKLSDDKLQLLEGKIATWDVQSGCPVQCVVCAEDAPKWSRHTPWKDVMTLSDSISEVAVSKKIRLLNDVPNNLFLLPAVYVFGSSDAVYYYSYDGKNKKTIFERHRGLPDPPFLHTGPVHL